LPHQAHGQPGDLLADLAELTVRIGEQRIDLASDAIGGG
jgi:hypothetical protein